MNFISTHNLQFERGNPKDYSVLKMICPFLKNRIPEQDFNQFRIGTVHGLYAFKEKKYMVLAIMNDEPGNGHFDDFFEWFEYMSKRDKVPMMILEIWNKGLEKHLLEKRGFKKIKRGCIKYFH